ncbi:MAG: excinuclease ABC subunit UvrA, partial [Bacteroidota bacterium]
DLDIISQADWILDLGPESGAKGGDLLYEGPVEGFWREKKSLTAHWLKQEMAGSEQKEVDLEAVVPPKSIELRGVSTHLLQKIDVSIPHNKLTVITGLSGSGKSSLAFDTLFAEARSRFAESLSTYARNQLQNANPARLESAEGLGPVVAVGRKYIGNSPRSTVGTLTGLLEPLRLLYSRLSQLEGHAYSARHFSFNDKSGACPTCEGLGYQLRCNPQALIVDPTRSILEGTLIQNRVGKFYGDSNGRYLAILAQVGRELNLGLDQPFESLTPEARDIVLYGTGERIWEVTWAFKNRTRSGTQDLKLPWLGLCVYVEEEFERKQHNKDLRALEAVLHPVKCPACNGGRLRPELRAIRFEGHDLATLTAFTADELLSLFTELPSASSSNALRQAVLAEIRPKIIEFLQAMQELGLGYISLDRGVATLSGGEAQRLRLVQTLAAQLFGVTYVLDEPTVGLHPKDTGHLLHLLRKLVDRGNTVVVVEHDEDLIRAADHLIELGPGAGTSGGQIVAQGDLATLLATPASPTGTALQLFAANAASRPATPLDSTSTPFAQRPPLTLKNIRHRNLDGFDLHLRTAALIAISGVSGS